MGRAPAKMTVEEYLALEWEPGIKLDWVGGGLYWMSGGQPRHRHVALNLAGELQRRLGTSPCVATGSGQSVHVRQMGRCFSPDVCVICSPWDMLDDGAHSVTNPVLVADVVSPSAERSEGQGTFECYRRIPSLQHYLLVDIAERQVTLYTRTEEGWNLVDLREGTAQLTALDIELPLAEIFAKLEHVPDL